MRSNGALTTRRYLLAAAPYCVQPRIGPEPIAVALAVSGYRWTQSGAGLGERVRLGLSFGQTGEVLRGEASLGYGRQRPDAAELPDVEIFLVDANLAWRIMPLTSLLLTAETSNDETSLAGASASGSRRMGLAVRHAFRRHLIGEAGVTYATRDYVGSSLDEHEIEFRGRAEYVVDRYWAFFSEARHNLFRSTAPDRDYEATSIRAGVRLRN